MYCYNNPTRYVDPSGHVVTTWDEDHLNGAELARLTWISNNWFEGTAAEQNAWRAEAEAMRAKYRSKYEQTDEYGYTAPVASKVPAKTDYAPSVTKLAEKNSLPATGKPNSTERLYGPDGKVKQERTYGPDGRAVKDTDYSHSGENHEFPHEHDWDWSNGVGNRLPARPVEIAEAVAIGVSAGYAAGGAAAGAEATAGFFPMIIPRSVFNIMNTNGVN